MSDPNNQIGGEVDPSEGAINEGDDQQQSYHADAAEGEGSAMLEVDPSEGPTE
jgi:hypothetical protein